MILLSTLVPSISVWSVWDLPLWAWRSYAALHDQHVEQLKRNQEGA